MRVASEEEGGLPRGWFGARVPLVLGLLRLAVVEEDMMMVIARGEGMFSAASNTTGNQGPFLAAAAGPLSCMLSVWCVSLCEWSRACGV